MNQNAEQKSAVYPREEDTAGEGQACGCRVLVDSDGLPPRHSAICGLCNLSLLDYANRHSLECWRLLTVGNRAMSFS